MSERKIPTRGTTYILRLYPGGKMIKIGDKRYEVILEKHGSKTMTSSADSTHFYQRIRIDLEERKFDGIEGDLWHEIIEMINTEYNLKLDHQTITALGSSVHQVLIDNAQYLADFRMIVNKEKGI
jgi:hypothetical protein